MEKDYLVRGLAFNDEIRIFVADASRTVQEAQRRHDSWSASTAAMGRTLVGTLFLGAALKGEDTVTVRLQGSGPIAYILAEADAKGQVKAFIKNPQVSLDPNAEGKIDVGTALGLPGQLIVSKDLGLKEPYVGQVDLVSGEIAEDFTYYMASSEQTPSAFGLGVLVNPDESVDVAGGFMIQVMPGASEETIAQVEENISQLPQVTQLLKEGNRPEDIAALVCQGGDVKVLSTMPVSFSCNCSKERFGQAMIALGKKELKAMMDEDQGAEAKCQFCRQTYHYSLVDLEDLYAEA